MTLGGGPILYKTQIQRVAALNTCEAELLAVSGYEQLWAAMSTAAKHTLDIRGLLVELGFRKNGPTPILCDNGAACTISQVGDHSKRTMYIAVRMAYPTKHRDEAKRRSCLGHEKGERRICSQRRYLTRY